jgi:sodium/bile acid cotransporter 7
MRYFLWKRWFLLLLVAGVTLAGFFPHKLRPLSDILEVRVVVASALFLMAWCLESRILLKSLLPPWPALWAVTISFGLMPVLGWIGGSFLSLADFRVGLMVSVSVPCTLASAVLWTRMAGGNEATALWVTLLTTGTSWLATTGWLDWGTGTQVNVEKASLMQGLLLVLVLPVALGQVIRAIPTFSRFALRQKTSLGFVSKILILSIIWKAAVDVFEKLEAGTASLNAASVVLMVAVCLFVHLSGLAAGFWSSRAFHFDRPNQIAVAFACSQKSLPVALFLYQSYFQDYPLAVLPLAFFHMGQLLVDTLIAERMVERIPQERAIAPGSEFLT